MEVSNPPHPGLFGISVPTPALPSNIRSPPSAVKPLPPPPGFGSPNFKFLGEKLNKSSGNSTFVQKDRRRVRTTLAAPPSRCLDRSAWPSATRDMGRTRTICIADFD